MAKLDLTGLMTGLPTDQDLRTQGQARAAQIQGGGLGSNLARGIASRAPQREEMMRQGLGGMFGVDTRTGDQQQKARMQQALSGLKLDTPEGLMQLAKIQQSTGDMAGASKSIAAARSLTAQKQGTAQATKSRDAFGAYLDRTYPTLGLGDLARADTITPADLKTFLPLLQKEGDRYKVVGSSIFDTDTETFITGPEGSAKAKDDVVVVNKRLFSLSKNAFITDAPETLANDTQEMSTWKFIKATNEASGIETPPFDKWRKGEQEYKDRTPQRKAYDELALEAQEEGRPFKTYNDWFESQKKADTKVVKSVDRLTGIETSTLVNSSSGDKIADLGISSMPRLEIRENEDKTYSIFNPMTGTLGESVDTAASAAAKQQKFYKTLSLIRQTDNTMGILSDAQTLRTEEGVGGVEYTLLRFLPITDARELSGKISTVQAALAFGKLQEMRDNSPTGGALGNVSNLELGLLKDSVSALDGMVSYEAFNKQVSIIQHHYNNFKASLLGQADYRVEDGNIYIQGPNGEFYEAGQVQGGTQ